MQLSDYAQALGAAQALVPQWDEADQRRAALQGQQVQNQIGQQTVVANQQALAAQQQAAARNAAFHTQLAAIGNSPDPAHLRAIGVQFPEFAEPLIKMVDGMDKMHREQVFHDTSQVYAGLGNAAGYAGARAIIQRHIDADKAAGHEPDPTDTEMVAAIDSGDADKIATARGLARAIATAASPDGAKTLFGAETEEASSTSDGAIYMSHGPRAGTVVRQGVVRESNALPVPIYDDQGHRVGTQLIPNGGRGGGPVSSGSVPATGAEIEALATGAIPGIQVTSRQRSAAHNAAVGGVPNSFHLTDQARDFTPPAGTSMSALASQLRTALPGFQVIQENNHVHVEPTGHPGAASTRTIGPVRAAAGASEPTLDNATVSTMAQQYLAGDPSVLTNLGRGKQGSANIVRLRSEIARQAAARGLTGAQIAAQMVQFKGDAAAMRTAGTRSANADLAVTEARNLIPLALRASNALPRNSFLPFSRAAQAYRSNTNNPLYREFVAANTSLINTYARAISPSGTSTVSDKEHARDLLDTAFDQPSYARVVAQLDREMQAALAAPGQVRQDIYNHVGGGGGHAQAPANGPRQVRTLQEAQALPKGTVFLDPRGVRRVR